MEKNKFEVILTLIVQNLVAEITEQEKISELEATKTLYSSQLYNTLEQENTKLWHLSPKALYELYKQEQHTGKITYPEEM
jgi:hypothetical protein